MLREAAAAVTAAHADECDHLDPTLLADLRARYDKAVAWGITTNQHRDWAGGNHPGYTLARRLAAKADQVFTFTRNLAVPWTNNAAEQALKGPKRHQAVSGYWHTLTTLADYCRVRSYLVSTRNHGIHAIDAIHAALTGNPWLPWRASHIPDSGPYKVRPGMEDATCQNGGGNTHLNSGTKQRRWSSRPSVRSLRSPGKSMSTRVR